MTTLRRLAGIESHRDGWTQEKLNAEAKASDDVPSLHSSYAKLIDGVKTPQEAAKVAADLSARARSRGFDSSQGDEEEKAADALRKHFKLKKTEAMQTEAKAAKPDPVAKMAEKLAQMTYDNDHTGAVIELAKFSKDKDLLKAAQGIQMIHAGMGSMPYEVSTFRNFLHKQIIAAIADTQGKSVADTLDKAF